jgi:hypothetical protein
MDVSAGVMAMDCSTAGKTVSNAEFEVIEPDVAVIAVEPVAFLSANPVGSMVATVGSDEVQLTEAVTF